VTADLDLYTGLPKVGNSLAVWADDARQAASVAVSLAPTPFVPQSLRGRDDKTTAANITAAILTGAELGLTPMASLRSIVVIQGTPAMTAVALRGLVQSAGHEVWIESSSDSRVVACGRRRGSDQTERSVWTIDRAQKLGLTGKDNWKKQPESMLVARATSEVCRRIAADALLGLPYTVEEIADTVESEPQRTARRRAQREPAPMPEPALEDVAPAVSSPPETPPPDEPPITDAQSKKLHAALGDNNLSDREAGLAYIGDVIGREITSSKELTKAEASQVIDSLGESYDPAEPPLDDSWPAVKGPES
jgi:tetrahydromethanopterin S-methyltransferase subunit B